jgi:hypothetical protein
MKPPPDKGWRPHPHGGAAHPGSKPGRHDDRRHDDRRP